MLQIGIEGAGHLYKSRTVALFQRHSPVMKHIFHVKSMIRLFGLLLLLLLFLFFSSSFSSFSSSFSCPKTNLLVGLKINDKNSMLKKMNVRM